MYNIPYFKADNYNEVLAFMQAHPFITLCGCDKDHYPVATHIPVLIEERDERMFLQAHVMRKQKHTVAFEHNPNVLAIFSGAHTYVSASWYKKKEIASTWNYQAVHAKGVLHWKDEIFLHALLTKLTATFENDMHSPSLVSKMSEAYVQDMIKAIVAFEVEITSIEHVFKLSQNRDEESYENIIHHLQSRDDEAKTVATIMQKRKDKIFKNR